MSGSTGQVVGGVVGAVVGFYVGGPTGAQYGWAIGSTLGAIADPEKVQGPRLQDRTVQVSSYGQSIPIIYGGDAVAGNVIWATELQETATESGGKGGPEVTSYSYSVSCAILIAEGELPGLRRIWADAKLVYDASEDADEQTRAASTAFAEFFTFYGGAEDQLPDPTMEAALEAGNVSAYRGYCYVVFTDLPLGEFGNRIPNFRFEIGTPAEESSSDTDDVIWAPLRIYPWTTDARPIHSRGEQWTSFRVQASPYDETFTNYAQAVAARQLHWANHALGAYADQFIGYQTSVNFRLSLFPESLGPATVDGETNNVEWVHYSLNFEVPNVIAELPNRPDYDNWNFGMWGDSMKRAGCAYNWDPPVQDARSFYSIDNEGSQIAWVTRVHHPELDEVFPEQYRHAIATYVWTSATAHWGVVCGAPVENLEVRRLPAPPPDVVGCPVGDPDVLGEPAQMPGNACFCLASDGTVTSNDSITYEVVEVSNGFRQLAPVLYLEGLLYQNALGPVLPAGHPDWDNAAFWDAARTAALADGSLQPDFAPFTPVVVDRVARGERSSGCELQAQAELNADLGVIVADLCRRAGMPFGSYDVAALYGIVVQGYTITRQMLVRAALLPLQQCFWWDFVESGAVLKAVLRGAAPAATIGLDDLGATESGESAIRVVPNRSQETELPATVTVTYPVRLASYEAGTQRARRVTTRSQQEMAADFAVVMPDAHASDVADVLMYAAWTNRTVRQFATTRKHARLEPTDVVAVNDGEFSVQLRLVERVEDGPVIRWTGVDERPAAYAPITTPGPVTGGGSGSVRYDGPMKLLLLDIPLLRDVDDTPGHYAAAGGYTPAWTNGTAFRSYDDGATFAVVRNMDRRVTYGYATTALGDFGGGNMVDEANTVTVRMHHGSLATITQAALLSDGNAALLGQEIIQFKRADLASPDVYVLSGLLRGRCGTEQHMATHAVDDAFVLLAASSVYRIEDELDKLGVAAVWKGVSPGSALADALPVDFTNTGISSMPLAPVHLRAVPLDGTTLQIDWERRTRKGGTWRPYVDALLAEETEQYHVRLATSGDVTISEQTVTANTATVTIASAPAGSVITVRQLSASVGPGFPASVTVA
jgi:hypothetical protein